MGGVRLPWSCYARMEELGGALWTISREFTFCLREVERSRRGSPGWGWGLWGGVCLLAFPWPLVYLGSTVAGLELHLLDPFLHPCLLRNRICSVKTDSQTLVIRHWICPPFSKI